jgi:hypothetical protein
MDVRQVDPRDIGWQIDSPAYRVYFWEEPQARPAVPESLVMWQSNEFELTGADDVTQVLAWAKATGNPGSTYAVYAVVEGTGDRGLVRLAGVDPTASDSAT